MALNFETRGWSSTASQIQWRVPIVPFFFRDFL